MCVKEEDLETNKLCSSEKTRLSFGIFIPTRLCGFRNIHSKEYLVEEFPVEENSRSNKKVFKNFCSLWKHSFGKYSIWARIPFGKKSRGEYFISHTFHPNKIMRIEEYSVKGNIWLRSIGGGIFSQKKYSVEECSYERKIRSEKFLRIPFWWKFLGQIFHN